MTAKPAPDAPNLKIVYRAPTGLLAHEKNSRTHSDAQIEQIKASIREFGFTNPVLLAEDNATLIAGHARTEAAKQLSLKRIPTITLAGLSPTQIRALIIADNKLAENAGWDTSMLAAELSALKAANFDLSLTGFDPRDLISFLANKTGETDPDDLPEQPAPVAALGDIWILGEHRIACGSSTDVDTVAALLDGARPHLMVTDPPYGVEYDASWRQKRGVGGEGAATGKVLNDHQADWREAWELFPGSVAYIWHAGWFAGEVMNSLKAVKFNIRAQIIWVKPRLVLGRGDYHEQKEPCFYAVEDGADDQWRFVPEHEVAAYAVKKGEVGQYHGGRKQSTVWNIEHVKSDTGHSTQKPIECMKRPIENNSRPGDAIYEPFSGSGTTLLACQMTARRCYAVELNPAYVDLAIVRWQNFTGLEAVRAADGATFASLTPES